MASTYRKKGMPPLDWLRIFEAAGRLRGFSAAAREFDLTQAAVSQRIRNLENWLGRELFVRSARGVTLTYAGESYLPLVQEALQTLEHGTEDLFGTGPRELRVAGLSSHLDALVLPRLPTFLERWPDIRLVTDSVPQRSNFDEEKTWLQVRYGRGRWSGLESDLICAEHLVPMISPVLTGHDWRELPVIEIRGERAGWQEWAKKTGEPAQPGANLSVDSMKHGLTAASRGLGVVLGSLPLAGPMIAEGRLCPLDLPSLPSSSGYWLTWPEAKLKKKRMRALVMSFRDALVQTS